MYIDKNVNLYNKKNIYFLFFLICLGVVLHLFSLSVFDIVEVLDTFIRWNTGINSFGVIGVLFQEPRLQGLSSRNHAYRFFLRNHAYRCSLPGTTLIGVLFQELLLQGFSSRNHAYRGSLPGTTLGVFFKEPRI